MVTKKKPQKKTSKKQVKKKLQNNKTKKQNSNHKKEIVLAVSLIIILGVGITLGLLFAKTPKNKKNVVAYVNEQPIYQSDFIKFKDNMIKKGYPVTDDMVLEQMISQKLLIQGAKKTGITVSEQQFNNFVELYLQQTGLNEQSLRSNLSEQNISYDEFKQATMDQLMVLNYLNETIRAKTNITDKMIQQFYEQSGTNRTLDEVHDQIKSILEIQLLQEGINKLVGDLKSKANIQILNGTDDKIVVESNYKETGEALCTENNKPLVLLFTANDCKSCEWVGSAFKSVIKDYKDLSVHVWNLNTNDDLLTLQKETSIPKEQKEMLSKLDKNMAIPTIIFGCKYVTIGTTFDSNQVKQEKALIKNGIDKLLINS